MKRPIVTYRRFRGAYGSGPGEKTAQIERHGPGRDGFSHVVFRILVPGLWRWPVAPGGRQSGNYHEHDAAADRSSTSGPRSTGERRIKANRSTHARPIRSGPIRPTASARDVDVAPRIADQIEPLKRFEGCYGCSGQEKTAQAGRRRAVRDDQVIRRGGSLVDEAAIVPSRAAVERRIKANRSTHAGCVDSRYGLKRIRPRRRPRFRRPSAGSPKPARRAGPHDRKRGGRAEGYREVFGCVRGHFL